MPRNINTAPYSNMDFPDYVYRPFPKWVRTAKREKIVNSQEEADAFFAEPEPDEAQRTLTPEEERDALRAASDASDRRIKELEEKLAAQAEPPSGDAKAPTAGASASDGTGASGEAKSGKKVVSAPGA